MGAKSQATVVKKDSAVIVLKQELSPFIVSARDIEVSDEKTMKRATEILSQVNVFMDRIKAEKEKVTKPLNEALKAERERWKPVESIGEKIIEDIRGKMSAYQTAEMKRIREAEQNIASRVGEGKGKLKVETAVAKIENLERPEDKVTTETGMVKFREDKILKIVDPKLIPREYLVIDEKKVLADLKAGKTIPGAEIDTVMIPLNFR